MNLQPVASPNYRDTFFLGGPMHGEWFSVADTTESLTMRFSQRLSFMPEGRERYTRRKFVRLVGDDEIEVAYVMAAEDWPDEDIAASMIPESAWRIARPEELA